MLFASRVSILVTLVLTVLIGSFLVDKFKINDPTGILVLWAVLLLVLSPLTMYVFKRIKGY